MFFNTEYSFSINLLLKRTTQYNTKPHRIVLSLWPFSAWLFYGSILQVLFGFFALRPIFHLLSWRKNSSQFSNSKEKVIFNVFKLSMKLFLENKVQWVPVWVLNFWFWTNLTLHYKKLAKRILFRRKIFFFIRTVIRKLLLATNRLYEAFQPFYYPRQKTHLKSGI